jgi:DNA-binding response OmpR family regulator
MKRILVVEDEQMLARIIGMKLEEEGYEVTHAYDGEQAYQALIQPVIPDLVLLDILLPKMSGFDVLTKLHEEKRAIPKVIVFSNFAQKSDVEQAQRLGAIDYIVKAAFSPAEILSKVKAVFMAAEADAAAQAQGLPVDPAAPSAYAQFQSIQEVMPMSEVLRPGEPNNNP